MTVTLIKAEDVAAAKAKARQDYIYLLRARMDIETREFKSAQTKHDNARKKFTLDEAQLDRWWG